METVQQNVRFTLFSSKFHSNIYSLWLYIIDLTLLPRGNVLDEDLRRNLLVYMALPNFKQT